MAERTCSIDGCGKPAHCRGWCEMHYTRFRRHGDPEVAIHIHDDDEKRLRSRVVVDSETNCWNWRGSKTSTGYGQFRIGGRSGELMGAHRAAWLLLRGPLSPALDLDHLCRNRGCCNPDHLEPVTHRENLLRGDTIAAENAAKTHCIHGHEFTSANTYIRPNNKSRACRTCRKINRARVK